MGRVRHVARVSYGFCKSPISLAQRSGAYKVGVYEIRLLRNDTALLAGSGYNVEGEVSPSALHFNLRGLTRENSILRGPRT